MKTGIDHPSFFFMDMSDPLTNNPQQLNQLSIPLFIWICTERRSESAENWARDTEGLYQITFTVTPGTGRWALETEKLEWNVHQKKSKYHSSHTHNIPESYKAEEMRNTSFCSITRRGRDIAFTKTGLHNRENAIFGKCFEYWYDDHIEIFLFKKKYETKLFLSKLWLKSQTQNNCIKQIMTKT